MRGARFVSPRRPRGSRRRRRRVNRRVPGGTEESGGGRGWGVRRAWAGRAEGLDARILADLEQQLPPSMKPFLASTPVHAARDGAVGTVDRRGDPLQGCVHAQPARDQGGVPGDRSIGRCETQGMRLARRGSCELKVTCDPLTSYNGVSRWLKQQAANTTVYRHRTSTPSKSSTTHANT